jgi:hypothetical protein
VDATMGPWIGLVVDIDILGRSVSRWIVRWSLVLFLPRCWDGDASKAILHLPLDMAVVSTNGNTSDSSNSFTSGSVQASRRYAPARSKS